MPDERSFQLDWMNHTIFPHACSMFRFEMAKIEGRNPVNRLSIGAPLR
jgi:hypothetical protein